MSSRARLPSVDRLLSSPSLRQLSELHGRGAVKDTVRNVLEEARNQLAQASADRGVVDTETLAARVSSRLTSHHTHRSVFNLTGTIIHTNLGRALIGERVFERAKALATHPMNLEFDLITGKRGKRDTVVTEPLCRLSGAAAATVVNNNAAALTIVLNTLALGARVPVSRGELVEIGGSFRLPELMTRAGCHLMEVGTTNRTHARDYAAALTDGACMVLKVHPSNFAMEGFTADVGIAELADMAHAANVPLVVDLGSGTLIDLTRFGLPHEPTVQEVLRQGADLVTFSGDKLLGAVQAGLIVGRADLVEQIDANPLKRALRCDKITLAILGETLKCFEDPETLREQIPLYRLLTLPVAELEARARAVLAEIAPAAKAFTLSAEAVPSMCEIGSGSLPTQGIDSISVRITGSSDADARALLTRLRQLPTPVIGRLHDGAVWLDMRLAEPLDALTRALGQLTETA